MSYMKDQPYHIKYQNNAKTINKTCTINKKI